MNYIFYNPRVNLRTCHSLINRSVLLWWGGLHLPKNQNSCVKSQCVNFILIHPRPGN